MKVKIYAIWLVLFSICACSSSGKHSSTLTIRNMSGDTIVSVGIHVCKQHYEVKKLPPNGQDYVKYRARFDSSYELDIKLSSGKTMQKKLGYVTNGFCFNDTLIIMNDTITLVSSHIECK